MSYNGKFQSTIVKECIESDRKKSLSRELKEFKPNDVSKSVPFRKVKCFQAGCESMAMHTDLNVTFPFMANEDDKQESSGWIGRDCKDCYCGDKPNKSDYRGTRATTKNNCRCKDWDNDDKNDYPDGGLQENYCRNPSQNKQPWCFLEKSGPPGGGCRWRWRYCEIENCDQSTWEKRYSCPEGMLAVNLEHDAHDKRLRKVTCASVNNMDQKGIVVGPKSTDTPSEKYFSSSEFDQNEGECKEGYLVAGIECQDLNDQKGCTHIRLICRKVTVSTSAFYSLKHLCADHFN